MKSSKTDGHYTTEDKVESKSMFFNQEVLYMTFRDPLGHSNRETGEN